MKIAQLVSNFYSVSPAVNQAIYSHVAWLANGLKKMGHEVDVYAAGDSQVEGKLHSISLPKALNQYELSEKIKNYYLHLLISQCYKDAAAVDIIHSHFSVLSSFYSNLTSTPTIQSIHSPITDDIKPVLEQFKTNRYISFSLAQRKLMPNINWVANIYHGVNTDIFSFNAKPDDYFLFIGRITEDKGVHLAIEAAQAAGVKLIIAGRSYPSESYWHDKIEKNINGSTVRYIGNADFEKKIELFQKAKAILMPIQWDEPFGLVMIEAMSCGTPVIGWKKGSVPEVVQDKKTGYVVNSIKGMVQAIKAIDKISRKATRERAEKLFSVEKMVSGYQKVYERIIIEHRKGQARSDVAGGK